jgi:hypothetical protein
MKRLLFVLSCMVLSFFTFGQSTIDKIKCIQGPEDDRTTKLNFVYADAVGCTGGQFYGRLVPWGQVMTSTTATHKYKLFCLNKTLNLNKYQVMEPKQDKMPTEYEFMVMMKGQLYLCVSFQNQKLKKTILLARPINNKTLQPEGSLEAVAEVDYSKYNKYRATFFNYYYSPDSSRLLLRYGMVNNDNMLLSYGFNVLDEKMKIIWGLDNQLPATKDKVYGFDQFAVSNEGDVYLLCKMFDSKKEFKASDRYKSNPFVSKREQQPNFSYILFKMSRNSETRGEYNLVLDKNFVRSLSLGISGSGKVVAAGLYGTGNNLSTVGCCSFILGDQYPNGMKVSNSLFDFEILTKGMGEKDRKSLKKYYDAKEEFEDYLYSQKDILFRSDGGFWMTSEQVRKRIKNDGTYVNNNDAVFVVSYSGEGEILWMNKLWKEQQTKDVNLVHAGIFTHASGDNLYLIYNVLQEFMGELRMKDCSAWVAEYNASGEEKVLELLTYEKSEVVLCPSYAGYRDKNNIVFYGMKGLRRFKFVEFSFD